MVFIKRHKIKTTYLMLQIIKKCLQQWLLFIVKKNIYNNIYSNYSTDVEIPNINMTDYTEM